MLHPWPRMPLIRYLIVLWGVSPSTFLFGWSIPCVTLGVSDIDAASLSQLVTIATFTVRCVQALHLQRPGGQSDRYACCTGLLLLQWFSTVSVPSRQMWGQVRALWPIVAANPTLLLLSILLLPTAPVLRVNVPEHAHDRESHVC